MTAFNIGMTFGFYAITRNTEDGPVEDTVDTFAIGATSPRGDTWVLDGSDTTDEAAATRMLATLGDCNPETAPDRWLSGEPLYGSDAWDSEAEYSLACAEADAFGEPRPRW